MPQKFFRLFRTLAKMSFAVAVVSKLDFWSFVAGKLARMGIFLALVLAVFRFTPTVAGFDRGAMLLLFATMNLIDITVQVFFFRGLVNLQSEVLHGTFDFVLTKPASPLLLVVFRNIDLMDIITLLPAGGILIWAVVEVGSVAFGQVLLYMLLVLNGIALIFGLSLFFAGLTFYSTQTENIWWFYRYGMQAARFPADIYSNFFRVLFTYILPIAVIVTFPVKAYLGVLAFPLTTLAIALSFGWLLFGIWFWSHALAKYQSASS